MIIYNFILCELRHILGISSTTYLFSLRDILGLLLWQLPSLMGPHRVKPRPSRPSYGPLGVHGVARVGPSD
jgi:hypothetical protein